MLVNSLTSNREFDILDRTLGGPAVIEGTRSGGSLENRGLSLELNVHVGDEITVTGDRDRDAAGVGGSTVHGLLDVLHSEVGVALVNRLEKGNLGVTGKVDILGTIGNELH